MVTANKSLLAERKGPDLFATARREGVSASRFEASLRRGDPLYHRADLRADGQPHRCDVRHPQRHVQLHPHGDDHRRQELCSGACRGAAGGLCRGGPDVGRLGGKTRRRSWRSSRRWRSGCSIVGDDVHAVGVDGLELKDIGFRRRAGATTSNCLAIAERWPGQQVGEHRRAAMLHQEGRIARTGRRLLQRAVGPRPCGGAHALLRSGGRPTADRQRRGQRPAWHRQRLGHRGFLEPQPHARPHQARAYPRSRRHRERVLPADGDGSTSPA